MADDIQTRIDQVFAEGHLIDEAVEVAAAEAVERHRTSQVPLVIRRDDRLTDIPADQLDGVAGPSEPMTSEDLKTPRSAKALLSWFDERLGVINASSNVKRAALLREGLFKTFYDEMYPFALFVRRLYGDREDVICSFGAPEQEQGYDAVIAQHDERPSKTYVQLTTTAFDQQEWLRMRHFLEHGRVSAFGRIDLAGNVENELISHDELLTRAFERIEDRAKRKALFSHGSDYALVVAFDDWLWFGTSSDIAALTSFVDAGLPQWRINVGALYVVGLSGRTFQSFAVRK